MITLNLLLILTNILAVFGVGRLAGGPEYCYEEKQACSPENWPGMCQNGQQQTPIDIPTSSAQVRPISVDLHENSYKGNGYFVTNNGHSLSVQFIKKLNSSALIYTPSSSSYFLPDPSSSELQYRFHDAHFHWGENNTVGSEHSVDGKYHSMELHLVHYRRNYSDFSAALNSGDPSAFAVIGIFFSANPEFSPEEISPLETFVSKLSEVQKPMTSKTYKEPLDFSRFLPPATNILNKSYFYNYKGSLTTPECQEIVNWFVYTDPVDVTEEDISQFRRLQTKKGEELKPMLTNRRPVQPSNVRPVSAYPISYD